MCVMIIIGNDFADTVGDFRRMFGEPITETGRVPCDRDCLCGVDMQKTGDKLGIDFERDSALDYVATWRKTPNSR